MLNFRAKIIYSRNYAAGIRGNYHESSDCFEYPKKSLLKSSYQKNTCQNLPTPKYPEIENLKPQKIFDYPRHFKSGVPPPPSPDRQPSSTRQVLISVSSYLLPCYNKLNEIGSNESQNSKCFPGKRKEKRSRTKISCFRLYTREC